MRSAFRTPLCAFLAAVLTPLLTTQAAEKAVLPQDVREAFEWYETLGYPDVSKGRWIGVLPGEEVMHEGNVSKWQPTLGFLLSDDGDKFTILTPDLWRRTYRRKPAARAEERLRWKTRSLETDARALLAVAEQELDKSQTISRSDLEQWAGVDFLRTRLSRRTMLFVMAHACHRHKLSSLALEMCVAAKGLRGRNMYQDAADLRGKMQIDLGELAMWNLIEAAGGIEGRVRWFPEQPQNLFRLPSRKELLRRCRLFVELYPAASAHVARAREMAAMLERMVAEDAAHVPVSDNELAKLPVEEQVRELIFRLRDQNGHQIYQPADCSVFNDPNGDLGGNIGDTPAHRLVEIGLPAVPQLIAALDDDRLSRTVAFGRNFFFSHQIMTVGECAEAVLNRIAGRRFGDIQARWERSRAIARTQIAAWWQVASAKSEKEYYLDCLTTGTGNLDRLMSKIQAKWPEEVVGALLAGAEQAGDVYFRRGCIERLAKVEDDRVTPFLLHELSETPSGTLRLAAAQALRQRKVDDERIATALLREVREGDSTDIRLDAFRALREQKNPAAIPALLQVWSNWPISVESSGVSDFGSVLSALLKEPTDTIIRTVAAAMPQRSVEERVEIVLVLGGLLSQPMADKGKRKDVAPEVRRAAENVLARTLEDSDIMLKEGTWWLGKFKYDNPCVGDFALFALHKYSPRRYPWTAKADRYQRARERLATANQARKRQGLPELPLPQPPDKPLPPEQALRIVEVRIAPGLPLPDIFRTEIEKLLGEDLTIESLTAILARFSEGSWRKVPCLAFDVRRGPDLTGVVVTVGGASGPNAGSSCNFFASGKVGFNAVVEDVNPYFQSKDPFSSLSKPVRVGCDRTSLSNNLWLDSYFAPGRAALKKAAPTDPIEIQIAVHPPPLFHPALEPLLPDTPASEPDPFGTSGIPAPVAPR